MEQIERPLFKATVAESSGLATNISVAINNHAVDDSHLEKQSGELESKSDEMKNSIATDKSKAYTQKLFDGDNLRDSLISALKLFIRANIKWKRENLSAKAEKIYKLIRLHGLAMTDEGYEEESTLLESLLIEMAKPENAEALSELGLTGLVEALGAAQDNFSSLYSESASLEAGKETTVSATVLKRELFKTMKITIDYLNVMQIANLEKYGAVSAEVAELTKTLNQKIRNRNNN